VIAWALGQELPERVGRELEAAVHQRTRRHDAPDAEPA
jgi:hypothetical protein